MLQSYVLGFLFSLDGKKVYLIRKQKPDWQKGRLNGIGGKIEPNESSFDAMVREFEEEGGVSIDSWKWFCTLGDDRRYEIRCYYAYSHKIPFTKTDEEVTVCDTYNLPTDVIPNLNWLIPMALSFRNGETAERFLVLERYAAPTEQI